MPARYLANRHPRWEGEGVDRVGEQAAGAADGLDLTGRGEGEAVELAVRPVAGAAGDAEVVAVGFERGRLGGGIRGRRVDRVEPAAQLDDVVHAPQVRVSPGEAR